MKTPSASSPLTDAPTVPLESPARLRLWPVLLTLYFLSPLVGEVLSGSTPPLLFVQPFGFIFTPLLYGSSAILIREIVVRRRPGISLPWCSWRLCSYSAAWYAFATRSRALPGGHPDPFW